MIRIDAGNSIFVKLVSRKMTRSREWLSTATLERQPQSQNGRTWMNFVGRGITSGCRIPQSEKTDLPIFLNRKPSANPTMASDEQSEKTFVTMTRTEDLDAERIDHDERDLRAREILLAADAAHRINFIRREHVVQATQRTVAPAVEDGELMWHRVEARNASAAFGHE
jgi:hypothetical protein